MAPRCISVDRRSGSSNFGLIDFYLDGIKIGPSQSNTILGSLANSAPLRIGIRTAATSLTGGFVGAIDELEIFNRTLAAAEVMGIFGAGDLGKCK